MAGRDVETMGTWRGEPEMTQDELHRDMQKFIDYLQANGARVLSAHVWVNGTDLIGYGNPETATEALLAITADRLGLKVSPR